MGYIGILGCIVCTVYGQLVLKWRLSLLGQMPAGVSGKAGYFAKALLDPFVLSGFGSAFIASLFWMYAMTKFEVSFAYPFMSLAFIAVLLLSALLFHETVTAGKIAGLVLICAGIIVSVKF